MRKVGEAYFWFGFSAWNAFLAGMNTTADAPVWLLLGTTFLCGFCFWKAKSCYQAVTR